MTQKEKLIDLLIDGNIDADENGADGRLERCEKVADWLLASGVVVLPCERGSVVYTISKGYCDKREKDKCNDYCDGWDGTCEENNAEFEISICHFDYCLIDDIGKTVFLTREEAEVALKKIEGET